MSPPRRTPRPSLPVAAALLGVGLAAAPAHARKPVQPSNVELPGPIVNYSGFQMLEGGGARLYVHLSEPVQVEGKLTGTQAEYVLKDAAIPMRNNRNPLITRHFPSLVTSVKLVAPRPAKKSKRGKVTDPGEPDARIVVQLREALRPQHRVNKQTDGTAMLVVDFPKPSVEPSPEPDP
ncbi:MAG: hypothetical protein FJ104_14080, partial [Deltaproteobacteria bacterium]|nr:hypothetical protein [Deltaproteobacteria bacterium]